MMIREIKASVGQRLLWLLSSYRGQGGALNCPVVCHLHGAVREEPLQDALLRVVTRHESLRTTFARRDRQLKQTIQPPKVPAIAHIDVEDSEHPEELVAAKIRNELRTDIDPTAWPTRVTLYRLHHESYVLCLNVHHLVTDTWSCAVLQRELAEEYRRACVGLSALPAQGWQFSQFMAWQERQLATDGFGRQRQYWQKQLKGAHPPALPLSPSDPRASARQRDSLRRRIEPSLAASLLRLATAQRTTLFASALAVYYALLYARTSDPDVSLATVFANRVRKECQTTVGFLANLVVLRTQVRGGGSFNELVACTRTTLADALAYQDLPFHVTSQGVVHGPAIRMDDVVFQMLSEGLDESLDAGEVAIHGAAPEVAGRFDLELALMPSRGGLEVKLFFAPGRVHDGWAEGLIDDYVRLASILAADPDAPLDALLSSFGAAD